MKLICVFNIFQAGVCCIAPPLIHILNNQELCRRVFGGKLCFNVPASPAEPASSDRRKSAASNRNNVSEPSEAYKNLTGSIWKNELGEYRFERMLKGCEYGKDNGRYNRAFDYEVCMRYCAPCRYLHLTYFRNIRYRNCAIYILSFHLNFTFRQKTRMKSRIHTKTPSTAVMTM